ncbi:uncharacterized protein SPSK_06501 [Sporothrix schenckii 1099-18]|uniref:Methyltransferase type 11 domain-containing protein n=2 Tax=Sporothrix schenckii TaxID=29908 RepID=U7PT10_SPOS1|nr:uncharacterized protein SPSK_06501 [Sporothrix schenckii 1099-18]ERS98742.1 hypothetical protein HMPREF1624_05530 [Sporothrix schenckii ATCC 58251]KJR89067.1 hypothetical protein SPSK_06501 [Sporothrix schenckii 1099-18]
MSLLEVIQRIVGPWLMLADSAYYLPVTIVGLVRSGNWSTLFNWSKFQSAWFGRFWGYMGPQVRKGVEPIVVPLLKGRVSHGRKLNDGEEISTAPLPVSGTVIEVGPGSGMWVSVFKEIGIATQATADGAVRQRKGIASTSTAVSTSGGVTKIYGVEPNAGVHDGLRQRVHDAGLEDVYEIVPVGIQDVAANSDAITANSVDCVVTILCLCGIPSPRDNIRALYDYLKPGGRMYVFEHVCNRKHWSIYLYQKWINLFWPIMVGGCELQRDTGRYLRDAGPWTNVDLSPLSGELWFQSVPHVVGVLTK